jgi:glycosyltransferase involved in cell wall biosynthesis
VTFDQLVGEDALVSEYNRAQVVAFPSSMEPFGFIPIEAMACGTPVVGVCEGGVRETIVDGSTGYLTERTAADFGSALQRVLSDRGLAASLGDAGRRHVVENWTWATSTAMLENHLSALLGESINGAVSLGLASRRETLARGPDS